MIRPAGTRGYACECNHRSCRARLYLAPHRYRELRALGTVVSATCARLEHRDVVATIGEACAVKTSFLRLGEVA